MNPINPPIKILDFEFITFIELIEKYPHTDPVNIGTEEETSIEELVYKLLKLTRRENIKVVFDVEKPEGKKRKSVNVSKLNSIGFRPQINLEKGLSEVIDWYNRCFKKGD